MSQSLTDLVGQEFDEVDVEGLDEHAHGLAARSEEFRLRDPEGWIAERIKQFKALIAGYPEVDAVKAIAEAEAGYKTAAYAPPSTKQPATA